jgi:RimJ/RimL family protein N-acetyltransferase
MLRLDRKNGNEWELSIIVAPDKRSAGIGLAMLNALDAPGPLIAEVLPGNEHSHRLFQRAGWTLAHGIYCWPDSHRTAVS